MSEVRVGSSEVRVAVTEELRRMLDERGVEWWEATPCKTKWNSPIIGGPVAARELNGEMVLDTGYIAVTPAQAIDATLGRGTCRAANASEYAWDDFECSECGWVTWGFIMEHEGCGTVAQPNFCPNCGREVVNE